MRRTLGFVLGAAGVLALAVFLLAPSLPGEAARMAEIADHGRSSRSNPRSIFLYSGLVLLAASGAMVRR